MPHEYSPEQYEVVFDIEADDFTESGEFASLFRVLSGGSFQDLILDESERVRPFLEVWEQQILELQPVAPFASTMGMQKAFQLTPSLSGVVYLSNNVVASEELFDPAKDRDMFLDSRTINKRVSERLPWAADLTFSFPRIYEFFGYRNGWGFVRFPRLDDKGKDAGVLISCSTLDQDILRVMRDTNFGHIAHSYNRVWDHAVHDYLHNVILYTSPSFGIGRRSPLSLSGVQTKIDTWGRDMMNQKHNYEYWAHRSHRQITDSMLKNDERQSMLDNATRYVQDVFAFNDALVEKQHSERERMISYLLAIYLWPLNILFNPYSGQLKPIFDLLDEGPIKFGGRASETVRSVLLEGQISESPERLTKFHEKLRRGSDGITYFLNEASSPVELGIAGVLAEIGIERWSEDTGTLTFSEYLRLTVCVIGYRGLYEGWQHDLPILYQHEEVPPHKATIAFLEKLDETLSDFEGLDLGDYKLHGIVA